MSPFPCYADAAACERRQLSRGFALSFPRFRSRSHALRGNARRATLCVARFTHPARAAERPRIVFPRRTWKQGLARRNAIRNIIRIDPCPSVPSVVKFVAVSCVAWNANHNERKSYFSQNLFVEKSCLTQRRSSAKWRAVGIPAIAGCHGGRPAIVRSVGIALENCV